MKRLFVLLAVTGVWAGCACEPVDFDDFDLEEMPEFLRVLEETAVPEHEAWLDAAAHPENWAAGRYAELTEKDYREVADELDVEVAAIKAVVEVEAGPGQKGFWTEGKPLVNFDATMYGRFAPRCGVSLKKARKSHPEIFARPDARRYGSTQAAQQARLEAAVGIDAESAYLSTFWGMFQIGGFNWRKCGAKSIDDFVSRMSRSERDQLELFAAFIRYDTRMLKAIKGKKWLKFALIYNGPKAKSRGYHKRLESAYRKHLSGK